MATVLPLLASLATGCASDTEGAEAEQDLAAPSTVQLELEIYENPRAIGGAGVLSFSAKVRSGSLPCKDQRFSLKSRPSVFDGWSPENAAAFSKAVPGAEARGYAFSSCRNAEEAVHAWFTKATRLDHSVDGQLAASRDYVASENPIQLAYQNLSTGALAYYQCSVPAKKDLVRTEGTATVYALTVSCTSKRTPKANERGPLDFRMNPGPYAAVMSYYGQMLPPVAATPAAFAKVQASLLGYVGPGTKRGAMRTLSNECTLKVESSQNMLTLEHTTVSSGRVRRVELKAEDLLGFVEGDVFSDPLEAEGTVQGRFAAAQFRDPRDAETGTLTVRFERNTNAEGQFVRINGSTTYCRRLQP